MFSRRSEPIKFSLNDLIADAAVYERIGTMVVENGGAVTNDLRTTFSTQTVFLDLRPPLSDTSTQAALVPDSYHYSYVERCVSIGLLADPRPYRVQLNSAYCNDTRILRVLLDTWTWQSLLQSSPASSVQSSSASGKGVVTRSPKTSQCCPNRSDLSTPSPSPSAVTTGVSSYCGAMASQDSVATLLCSSADATCDDRSSISTVVSDSEDMLDCGFVAVSEVGAGEATSLRLDCTSTDSATRAAKLTDRSRSLDQDSSSSSSTGDTRPHKRALYCHRQMEPLVLSPAPDQAVPPPPSPQRITRAALRRSSMATADAPRSSQWRPYTASDDRRILDFFEECPRRLLETRGRAIWEELERQMNHERTWQSLKNRFLRTILRQLYTYTDRERSFLDEVSKRHCDLK